MIKGDPEPGAETDVPRPPGLPLAARIGAAVVLAAVAVHLFFTAVYDTPFENVRNEILPGEAATRYIEPYFQQDYQIFAPNPSNANRGFWVRARVETPDGETVTTRWVDAAAVELVEPHRRVLRKQLSLQAAQNLMTENFRLSDAQRDRAGDDFSDADDLGALREALEEADDSDVDGFIRAANFATSYATQVSEALWADDGDIVAVQVRSERTPVVRWDDRFDEDAEPPRSSFTDGGWLPPMVWSEQDREGFDRTFLRWAEKAGISGSLTDGEDDPGDGAATNGDSGDGGAGGDD